VGSNNRDLTARLGLDSSKFKKGSNEVKAELTQLNSAMLKNRREQKELEAQIKELSKQQKLNKQSTEEEKRQYEELTKKIDKATLELAGLKTEEQQLKNQVKETTKELSEQTDTAKKTAEAYKNVGNALATGVKFTGTAVAGMFAYTAEIAASADEINTLAKQTGLSTAEIQKFMYAAELIDVPLDTLTGSMAKLVKNMNTATKGTGDAYDAFLALGVSITDSTGTLRNNQEVFDECISALSKIEDETQRDAYAMSIFGKSAQDLNPLILGGTEQLKAFGDELEREGLILDQTQLDKLNEFNDKIDTFKAKFQATLAEGALEGVDAFEELFEKSDEIVDLVASLISGFAKFSGFIVDHKDAVMALVTAYGVFKASMKIGSLITSVISIIKSLTSATKEATASQKDLSNTCSNAKTYTTLASALMAVYTALISLAKSAMQTESNISGMVGTADKLRNSITESVSETEAEIEILNTKGKRYEELRLKINRTTEEEKELYKIASELEAAYPNQIELIGDVAGAYHELGSQIDEVGEKMLASVKKEAAAAAIADAFKEKSLAKSRMNALYEEITSSDNVSSTVISDDGSLKTRWVGIWELEEAKHAQAWLLGTEGAEIAELTAEYNELNDEIILMDKLISDLEKEYVGLANVVDYTESEYEDLNTVMYSYSDKTETVKRAQKEYEETQKLSNETIDNLIRLYPELTDEVTDYINGLSTSKNIIDALAIAYSHDTVNYEQSLLKKIYMDEDYWKKLMDMGDSAISALADKYGFDLDNYDNYAEAKLAIERDFLAKKAEYWEKYYTLETGQMKMTLKDITAEQKRLVYEEGVPPEVAQEITQVMYDEYSYVSLFLLPELRKFKEMMSADIDEGDNGYISGEEDSTGSNDDYFTDKEGLTQKENNIYQIANEAFKKLTNDRIEEIQKLTDAENNAADERIAAIEKEISAREKLRDTSDLQERIDFIKGQLKYSQLEEFERFELQRQLESLEEEQKDKAWLDAKNAEIEALQAQKSARDKETSELIEQLKANQNYANTVFTDLNNGYQSTSSIINNNTQQANVNIITDAFSLGQVEQVVKNAIGLGLII